MTLIRTYLFGCLLSLLVCLTAVGPSWALITFDHGTASADTAGATSVSVSFTVASCTNCIILLCVGNSGNTGAESTGVTFNTTETFTEAAVRRVGAWGAIESYAHLWYLVNPTVTTANVTASWASTTNNDRSVKLFPMLFHGVDQVAPIDSSNGNAANSSSTSVSTTTVAANAWIIDCVTGDSTMTVNGAQTARLNNDQVNTDFYGVSTIADKATPGAQAMEWTIVADDWVSTVVSLKPFVAASAVDAGNAGAIMLLLGR